MTNTAAFIVFVVVCAFVGYDLYTEGGMTLSLGRRFVDLVRYIAFWR